MAPRDELAATLRQIERAAGALATTSVARMDEVLPWFREAAGRPARLGHAGGPGRGPVAGGVAAQRPAETQRSRRRSPTRSSRPRPGRWPGRSTCSRPSQLIKVTIDVVEEQVPRLAAPGEEQALREAVLRFSREIAFAAARVYARAAETRGAWDARLQALLVDALLRGRLPRRAGQPGGRAGLDGRRRRSRWRSAAPRAARPRRCCTAVHRLARRVGVEVIGGVHGDRLVVVLGGADDPLAAAEKLLVGFGDGPVVVGPAVPSAGRGDRARPAPRSPGTGPPRPGRPRPDRWPPARLLPERALAGDAEARRILRQDVYGSLTRAGGELLETLDAFFAAGGVLESAARGAVRAPEHRPVPAAPGGRDRPALRPLHRAGRVHPTGRAGGRPAGSSRPDPP